MLTQTICYKLKKPVIYNKGTDREKSCSHFLEKEVWGNADRAKEVCDKMNAELDPNSEIEYYYVEEQEAMY